jgi:hypothetical protein
MRNAKFLSQNEERMDLKLVRCGPNIGGSERGPVAGSSDNVLSLQGL